MTGTVVSPSADGAGAEFATYVQQLATEQDARKASIEQRGLAVVTTSGTLVTVLFALVALLTKTPEYKLPVQAHGTLGLALVLFVVAAVLAVLTNVPLAYRGADLSDPQSALWDHWSKDRGYALQRITATRVVVAARAQAVNGVKAWLLLAAITAEVAAILVLAVALGEVLRHS